MGALHRAFPPGGTHAGKQEQADATSTLQGKDRHIEQLEHTAIRTISSINYGTNGRKTLQRFERDLQAKDEEIGALQIQVQELAPCAPKWPNNKPPCRKPKNAASWT
ncbi:MAG: hypothetical protein U0231_13760 [Nitrospiraceae bacterium]